ncbi:MAG: trigger factor [Flavobacteriaceae bacterium]|nr:trigger factor [Flavobacteriaceae bacterium]OUX39250.1 MAG: trigger factor [Flavobacteriaceae bacterium TMED265]
MKITKQEVDALNAVLSLEIQQEDYTAQVDKILKDYRKNANIPGFRKGQVPMGMIRKQYGRAVQVDEVNKMIQEQIGSYIDKEKLEVLGNPLPVEKDAFSWDDNPLTFDFELGLAPSFEAKIKTKKSVTHYHIVADKKSIDEQIERIRKQYGKLISQDSVSNDSEVNGRFFNEQLEVDHKTQLDLTELKSKKLIKELKGKKASDVLELSTKNLFDNDLLLARHLGVSEEKVKELDNVTIQFTVEEVNKREPAELDQELYDKLFGPEVISSEEELRAKLKEDGEKQFVQQSDQKLMADYTERLLEDHKFDLPSDFLKKWIRVSGEKPLTEEEALTEYEKSEKGIRYQLIEAKIIDQHELQMNFEELKAYAKEFIKAQMAQYGQMNPPEEQLNEIAARVMSNEDETRRLSSQLMNQKLLDLIKMEGNLKKKELNFEKFIKEAYKA